MAVKPNSILRSHPLKFLSSRLSQRIVLSVFSSIIAIEAIILIPSVYRREQELYDRLSEQSAASLAVLMAATEADDDMRSPQQLIEHVNQLSALPIVVGGGLYKLDWQRVGTFGEAPDANSEQHFSQQQQPPRSQALLNREQQRRYDAILVELDDTPYWLVVGHDTMSVLPELIAFIGRIIGLVIIISGVVTLSTMIVLRSILISPILALRNDLLKAAPAALNPDALAKAGPNFQPFASVRYCRNDELGEVIRAFEQMFERISTTIEMRQRAETMLRESEHRFRALVEQAAETILVLDQEAKIVDINPFALRLLGYRRDELMGRSLFDINPVITPNDYQAQWQQLQTHHEPVTLETVHCRKGGDRYPVEVRSSLMAMAGGQRMLSLARDISDRKRAEQALARLAEIGELAAMIVHEVRNPFTTVYMALSAFKRMELPPPGQTRLALALEESERLKRLLNEILAYSKEQKLTGEIVEINALVQELAQSLRETPAAENRHIQLQPAKEALVVKGDRDKLKQVFINLVTNACEAISPDETVTWQVCPSADCPSADCPSADQQIKIQVHNGGDPIPADVLPKLTQPFVSTKANGNGLGLAITKRIIEAHGGQLRIESTATTGTLVTVYLPLAEPER